MTGALRGAESIQTGKITRVSLTSGGRQARCNIGYCESTAPALSAHGRYVAFQSSATNLVPHDTNRLGDVFVRDRRTGRTTRVSVDSRGRQGGGDRTNNGSNAPVGQSGNQGDDASSATGVAFSGNDRY